MVERIEALAGRLERAAAGTTALIARHQQPHRCNMEAFIAWGERADAAASNALGLNYPATPATWIYVPVSVASATFSKHHQHSATAGSQP